MTTQEYYDLLVKSATDGTFPSFSQETQECLYRAPGNKKCALGIAIPDELYNEEFENLSPLRVINKVRNCFPESLSNSNLLEIQRLHDLASKTTWDAEIFIYKLNTLECFNDVKKVNSIN